MVHSAIHSSTPRPGRTTRSVTKSTVERGIKLDIDSRFRLPAFHGTPIPRRVLTSTYYDTASYDLAYARITLRHRIEKEKQVWQLKIPLGTDRQELEVFNQDPMPPASFLDLLKLHLASRDLSPVATLRVRRTGLQMRRGRIPAVQIVLDNVSVLKNDCVIHRFRELEIEQLAANEGPQQDLEQQLRLAGARDHDGRPKLFRALSLPAPGPDVPPAADAPVIDHLKWALMQHVRWLLAHDPGTRLGAESESLHQLRVATRRVRAVLRTAQPIFVPDWASSLQNELTWLSQFLGQARDFDVQIAYFSEEASGLGARDRKPLKEFISRLEAQRTRVQAVLLTELNSARYLELIRQLQQAARDPSVVGSSLTLHDLAKREFKKLRKAIRRLGHSLNPAKLHDVRIKIKHARYAAELAVWKVGKPASRFIKRARAVQDLLGTHQDALKAENYIRSFLNRSTSVRAGFVAGLMVERQRHRRESVRKKLKTMLKSLLKRGKNAWG